MRRNLRTLALGGCALVVLGALWACGGSNQAVPKKTSAEVAMKLIAFRPEVLEVSDGTKVTWIQKDAGFHSVTSGMVEQGSFGVTEHPDGKFDSGQIPTENTFSFKFETAGTFPYFCSVHPATMRGEVRVT